MAQFTEGTRFCTKCGAGLEAQSAPVPGPSLEAIPSQPVKPWHTNRSIIAIVILVILIGITATSIMRVSEVPTQQSQTSPTAAQTSGAGQWKTIETFAGSSDKDTEDFNVPTNYWRLAYTITAQPYQQFVGFSAVIYPGGKISGSVASVNLDKSGTDTGYVRAGPGSFWISIVAVNLSSWTIEVQIQE